MITNEIARIRTWQYIIDNYNINIGTFGIIDISETELFYVKTYNSIKYCNSRNLDDLWIGPGPIIVDKINGIIKCFGSATSIDFALKISKDDLDAGNKYWAIKIPVIINNKINTHIKTYLN